MAITNTILKHFLRSLVSSVILPFEICLQNQYFSTLEAEGAFEWLYIDYPSATSVLPYLSTHFFFYLIIERGDVS